MKWNRKKLKLLTNEYENAFYAVLVESKKIDGKPRHNYIAYLGLIKESDLTNRGSCRLFWKSALGKVNELDISEDQKQKIIEGISKKVDKKYLEEAE